MFNAASSGVFFVPPALIGTLDAVLAAPDDEGDQHQQAMGRALRDGGFLVPADVGELKAVEERYACDLNAGTLMVVVAPTMECNLACVYCFQERAPGQVDATAEDKIAGAIARHLEAGRYKRLVIDWFGGEPLVAEAAILRLSRRLQAVAQEAGVSYGAQMATNGARLPQDLDEFIRLTHLQEAQVTLDGPAEQHNARRPFRGGQPSFAAISTNCRRLAERLPVLLRINVDTTTALEPDRLLDALEEAGLCAPGLDILPYVASVSPFTEACADVCSTAFRPEAFLRYCLAFQVALLRRRPDLPVDTVMEQPRALSRTCGAVSQHTLGFDYAGRVFKCGLELHDPKLAAGPADDPHLRQQPNWRKWLEHEPTRVPTCRDCNYLPACMGGCPKYNWAEGYAHRRDACVFWHDVFPDHLRTMVRMKMERAREHAEEAAG